MPQITRVFHGGLNKYLTKSYDIIKIRAIFYKMRGDKMENINSFIDIGSFVGIAYLIGFMSAKIGHIEKLLNNHITDTHKKIDLVNNRLNGIEDKINQILNK